MAAKNALKTPEEREAELDQIRPSLPVDEYFDNYKKYQADMSEETRALWDKYCDLLMERGQEAVPKEWLERMK